MSDGENRGRVREHSRRKERSEARSTRFESFGRCGARRIERKKPRRKRGQDLFRKEGPRSGVLVITTVFERLTGARRAKPIKPSRTSTSRSHAADSALFPLFPLESARNGIVRYKILGRITANPQCSPTRRIAGFLNLFRERSYRE